MNSSFRPAAVFLTHSASPARTRNSACSKASKNGKLLRCAAAFRYDGLLLAFGPGPVNDWMLRGKIPRDLFDQRLTGEIAQLRRYN